MMLNRNLTLLARSEKSCSFHVVRQVTTSFQEDFQKNHIETTALQRSILGIGSALVSILNPHRGDMIATMGEVTGGNAISYMLSKMEESEEGIRILDDQPRINSRTVDLEKLKQMPDGTLGKTYSDFLEKNKVSPDSRDPVHFVDNIKLAYVMQRYREVHDLNHALLGMPTNMLGEVTVKWVEAIQNRLPMCIGGALFGPLRLKPKHRKLYKDYYLPWAIKTGYNTSFLMNIYFEKRWDQPVNELYEEINITPLELPAKQEKQ